MTKKTINEFRLVKANGSCLNLRYSFTKSREIEFMSISTLENKKLRIRLSVFRKDGGLYTPKTNEVDYVIEVSENTYQTKSTYKIDLFKDFYNYSGLLSTIKTTNRNLNTLASIYMEENELDNCVLLNENKGIVEATNANMFVVKGNEIKTPALTEGCIKGIVRKKVIEMIQNNKDFTLIETSISPFEMQKADELFLTNAIIGIQPVTNYRKKEFKIAIGEKMMASLKLQQTIAKG